MANLSLSIAEIIILMLGAIILGITIHFFLTSRRQLNNSPMETEKVQKKLEEWKLRYFNDIELRDKTIAELQARSSEAEENGSIHSIEAEELRIVNRKLKDELEKLRQAPPVQVTTEKHDYIDQLREAQSSLIEHNAKINQLLSQVERVKENEEKHQDIQRQNEALQERVAQLEQQLLHKDKEVKIVKEKEHLTREMHSMLDSAYSEFGTLQAKIQKLEAQLSSTKMSSMELEETRETNYTLTRELEELRHKQSSLLSENLRLREEMDEVNARFQEANQQKQQLQKRLAYLEDLNADLNAMTEANKKLEQQLKKVGELESRLNMVSEERDELARRKFNP